MGSRGQAEALALNPKEGRSSEQPPRRERVHSSLSAAGREATRKPLLAPPWLARWRPHSYEYFRFVAKIMSGIKTRPAGEVGTRQSTTPGAEAKSSAREEEGERESRRGSEPPPLRNFHFAGIVSSRFARRNGSRRRHPSGGRVSECQRRLVHTF